MISILMPIYNGIEFIDESVGSIISQTYNTWELIIGINGHSENSDVYKIAKKFESIDNRIKVYDLFMLKGKSITLNKMIEYCSYDYIALIDVDDIWEINKLEIQTTLLNKYDVLGTKCVYFGDHNKAGVVPPIPIGDITEYNIVEGNPIINSSCIVRKKICFWDKQFDGVEDYDLWIRLWKTNKTFYNFDNILVKHRIHTSSSFNAQGNHLKVNGLLKHHSSNEVS